MLRIGLQTSGNKRLCPTYGVLIFFSDIDMLSKPLRVGGHRSKSAGYPGIDMQSSAASRISL